MRTLALVKSRLSEAFASLGSIDMIPNEERPASNSFAKVFEYFVADMCASMANKRKEKAKEALIEIGVLTKPEVGSTETIYNKGGLQCIAQTKSPSTRIDPAMLNSALTKRYGAAKAAEIIAEATKTDKPATTYSFVVN